MVYAENFDLNKLFELRILRIFSDFSTKMLMINIIMAIIIIVTKADTSLHQAKPSCRFTVCCAHCAFRQTIDADSKRASST